MESKADVDPNLNVSWLDGRVERRTFFAFYILLVLGTRYILGFFLPDALAWTSINIFHGGITFLLFHWLQGSPMEDQGKYNTLTFWEQLDRGIPWTTTRKFLIVIPIILFLFASHSSDYEIWQLLINGTILTLLIVAKLPEMHKVRLFGINKNAD